MGKGAALKADRSIENGSVEGPVLALPENALSVVPLTVPQHSPSGLEHTKSATTSDKVCTKCGKKKSRSEFHKNKSKPDGLDASCKKCISAIKRKRRQTKKRRQQETLSFTSAVCGELSDSAISEFSDVFAVAVKELLHEKKI